MSLRDFAWQAELFFFFVLASGRRQFERGNTVVFLFELYFTIYFLWHEGSNTKCFWNLHVNLISNQKPNTVFFCVFSVMSVDVKHCRHVEHSFFVFVDVHGKHSPRSTAVMWNLLQVQSCLHVGCQWTHVDRVGQHSMFCAIFWMKHCKSGTANLWR